MSGVLRSEEIAVLGLKARLMVLSACQTGLGEIKGEGLLGLSRAIIQSGVPCGVLSLWQVHDAATSSQMLEMYSSLRQGHPVAAALRNAMLKMLSSPEWSHPGFWSPFFCSGCAQVTLT